MSSSLYLAVVHYPVYNKHKEIVTTAFTNLDIHDFARLARTYNIPKVFFISPLEIQKKLGIRLVDYWTKGKGGERNPDRKEALSVISFKNTLEEAQEAICGLNHQDLLIVTTTAREQNKAINPDELKNLIYKHGKSILLVFGTGFGLTEEFMAQTDYVLSPIKGACNYNHLSVRSAASIIVDRIYSYRQGS